MTEIMQAAVNEAIRKHIPSELGAAIREELERLEKLAEENRLLTIKMEKVTDECSSWKRRSDDFLAREKAIADKSAVLITREAEVFKREKDAAVVECKLACAVQQVEFARETLAVVFGNNKYKYQQTEQVLTPIPITSSNPGGYTNTEVRAHTTNVTKQVTGEGSANG